MLTFVPEQHLDDVAVRFQNKDLVEEIKKYILDTRDNPKFKENEEKLRNNEYLTARFKMINRYLVGVNNHKLPSRTHVLHTIATYLIHSSALENKDLYPILSNIDFSELSYLYTTSDTDFTTMFYKTIVRIEAKNGYSDVVLFNEALDILYWTIGIPKTLTLINECIKQVLDEEANSDSNSDSRMFFEKILEIAIYSRNNPEYPIEWLV